MLLAPKIDQLWAIEQCLANVYFIFTDLMEKKTLCLKKLTAGTIRVLNIKTKILSSISHSLL